MATKLLALELVLDISEANRKEVLADLLEEFRQGEGPDGTSPSSTNSPDSLQ